MNQNQIKTLKQAKSLGFIEKSILHYDGEELLLKGHTLIRNPAVALSETAWKKLDRNILPDQIDNPHCKFSWYPNCAKRVIYPAYRENQTYPNEKRKIIEKRDQFIDSWKNYELSDSHD